MLGKWRYSCTHSQPDRYTPGVKAPEIRWIGGLVDLRVTQDAVTKRKKTTIPPLPCWELNPGRLTRSLVSIVTELPQLLFLPVYLIRI